MYGNFRFFRGKFKSSKFFSREIQEHVLFSLHLQCTMPSELREVKASKMTMLAFANVYLIHLCVLETVPPGGASWGRGRWAVEPQPNCRVFGTSGDR